MAKKQNLDQSYLDWAKDVPQEILDKFLESSAAERIANLHGGMTKAQQRAAELEAERVSERARMGELDNWARQHQDLYQQIPQWAPLIRSHRAEEVERALAGEKSGIERQAAELDMAVQAGDLTYEQAVPIVLDLRKRYGEINGQVEEFKRFRETDVPKLVGAVEENFTRIQQRQDNSNRAVLEFIAEAIDYARAHPDRPVKKITETFMERNKDRQYKTFEDIARDAYGEEDTEALIEQRAAEKLAMQRKEQSTAQEVPISNGALGPFRRRQSVPVVPSPTTAAGVRTALQEYFTRGG